MTKTKKSTRKSNGTRRRGRGRGSFDSTDKVHTMSGHQIYSTVQNGSNGTQLFNSTNAVAVSPDSFGTTIAAIGNRFNQYKFTRLEFEYKPSLYNMTSEGPTGSQSNNLFAFGYESDGEVTFTVTHGNVATLQHAMIVPASGYAARRDNTLRVRPKDQWYYTENVTTDSATIRWTIQGILYGEALTSISTSTVYGEIWVRYTVQFRDLCPDQGVTLSSLMREARLGGSTQLRLVLTAVKHAVLAKNCAGELPKELAESLTNEEYRVIMGRGRPVAQVERVKPNWADLYAILGSEFAPIL